MIVFPIRISTYKLGQIIDKFYDAPIQSDKWRNLYFLKSGRSYFGTNIFSSKEEALAIAEKALVDALGAYKNTYIANLWPERVLYKELSHAIQIPWKGK